MSRGVGSCCSMGHWTMRAKICRPGLNLRLAEPIAGTLKVDVRVATDRLTQAQCPINFSIAN